MSSIYYADSPAVAPAMREDRVGDTPHRYYLGSQNWPHEPTVDVTCNMQNMHNIGVPLVPPKKRFIGDGR